jgi:hypothetical protein
LDPLCRLVIRIDQPLFDIRLKEATNIKLSITAVQGRLTQFNQAETKQTHSEQKAW